MMTRIETVARVPVMVALLVSGLHLRRTRPGRGLRPRCPSLDRLSSGRSRPKGGLCPAGSCSRRAWCCLREPVLPGGAILPGAPAAAEPSATSAPAGVSIPVPAPEQVSAPGRTRRRCPCPTPLRSPAARPVDPGVPHISGGIGSSEREAMEQVKSQYNLRLLFAVAGSGAYLSNIRVQIQDAAGPTCSRPSRSDPGSMPSRPRRLCPDGRACRTGTDTAGDDPGERGRGRILLLARAMTLSIQDLYDRLQLVLPDPDDAEIQGVNTLDQAGPQDLCFAEDASQATAVARSAAALVLVGEAFPEVVGKHLLRVAEPRNLFFEIALWFAPTLPSQGHPSERLVHPDARLGEDVEVDACAVIDADARDRLGLAHRPGGLSRHRGADRQRLSDRGQRQHPARLDVGRSLHPAPGCAHRRRGFRISLGRTGHRKVPQLGRVVIEDDVEIGCNSCVDRATLGVTRIGQGTKIDNLVQVAHNVTIGPHSILVSQSGSRAARRSAKASWWPVRSRSRTM
jgi:hypothetical protein